MQTVAPKPGRIFALTTRATRTVHTVSFQAQDCLVFGSETSGLPAQVRADIAPDQQLRLPMLAGQRSLNLSNAVAVTVFEAWRQHGFDQGV
jgi:tRNA (cytidine/uridine-2'-O-)-methyltransferase